MQINVNLIENIDKSYPIIIDNGALEGVFDYIKNATCAKKFLVVTNDTVAEIYLQKLLDKLSTFDVEVAILPDGEEFKTVESLQKIWDKAVEFKLDRSCAIIALGGGVIGDITGFAASSYLRGVDFIQIPTTLLAQVDSSVGGKVAINHKEGKNLLGAFYQPKFVLIDTKTLSTLPDREFKTGLAEVVKYAFIEKSCGCDENFDLMGFLDENSGKINNLNDKIMATLISYCCQLKASVVAQDEREAGLRAILNLGHTIGHAIEKVTNYDTFKHGEAVAMGLIGAFKMALDRDLISEQYFVDSIELIKKYGLLFDSQGLSSEKIVEATSYDKKVKDSQVRFILPVGVGEVDIFDDINSDEILEAVEFVKKCC